MESLLAKYHLAKSCAIQDGSPQISQDSRWQHLRELVGGSPMDFLQCPKALWCTVWEPLIYVH